MLADIVKGTATSRKQFQGALRRFAALMLRDNLESALKASLTDVMSHPDEDARVLLTQAQERIASVDRWGASPVVTQEMAMPEVLRSVRSDEEIPLPTFSEGLNKVLNGGLHFGHLTVVAGKVGSGKTSFLLQMADGIAGAGGDARRMPVVLVSTSADRRQLSLRSMARLTRTNAGALLSKRWVSGWEGDFLESEVDLDESKESVADYYLRRVREAEEGLPDHRAQPRHRRGLSLGLR